MDLPVCRRRADWHEPRDLGRVTGPFEQCAKRASAKAPRHACAQVITVDGHEIGPQPLHLGGRFLAAHYGERSDACPRGQCDQVAPDGAIGQGEADPIAHPQWDKVVEQRVGDRRVPASTAAWSASISSGIGMMSLVGTTVMSAQVPYPRKVRRISTRRPTRDGSPFAPAWTTRPTPSAPSGAGTSG